MLLITGNCGYIASHTTDYLKENSIIDIIGLDNLEVGSKENARCSTITADIRNIDELDTIFKNHKIDTVMHFAALTSVPDSAKEKDKYFDVNVNGTDNLLQTMIKYNCRRLIFSSTASVYMQSEKPVKEIDALQPLNNYALTKLYAEKLIKLAVDKDLIDAVIFRYFNVIGFASWYNYTKDLNKTNIVPVLLNSAKCKDTQNSTSFKVYGNCYSTKREDPNDHTCVRDYIDVRDIAKAHLLAYNYLNTYKGLEFFNLGTKNGSSVLELIRAFEIANNIKMPYTIESPRIGDPSSVIADNRKARELLGWKPSYTLEESLKLL